MKKITVIQIAILFAIGLTPFLWLHDGYFISNGDNIPTSLNAAKTLSSSINMWSRSYLGYASPDPSFLLNSSLAAALTDLGLGVGLIQILFQVILYMLNGFSMYYFAKVIYPGHKFAPFFAALFYDLNFFILFSRFNIGFAWTYAFMPLILALVISSVNAAYSQGKKSATVRLICFALMSVIPFSISSVNPANIALFLAALFAMAVYLLVKYIKKPLPFILTLIKIAAATVLVNIWWILPMVNTYFLSPESLGASVNVTSWSWTHQRASFLNIFWLNGIWGWNLTYIPEYLYYYYEANQFVKFLSFVPFILAGVALLFKSNKSRLNAYLAFCILTFVFLAKGLNYGTYNPLSLPNLALYEYFPLMSMFREPVSKFTLVLIPFLALLVGFATDKLIHSKFSLRSKTARLLKALIVGLITLSIFVSALPVFTGFAETKTEKLPYSSYVQIPNYWLQATDWINNQSGEWNVLLTPFDDFYMMPYNWGYYGVDALLVRLFEKPIISTDALDGYVADNNRSLNLMQLRKATKFSDPEEFKELLDIFNIKYIVQRNDVDTDEYDNGVLVNLKVDRDLKTLTEMRNFFVQQPYLKLVESYGQLDIYEYVEAKPLIYIIEPSALRLTDIRIDVSQNINETLDSSSFMSSQNHSKTSLAGNWIEFNASASIGEWVRLDSPLFPVTLKSGYIIQGNFSGKNNSNTLIKVAEYSQQNTLLKNWTLAEIGVPHFDKWFINQTFGPRTELSKYLNFQIYVNATSKTTFSIDNLNIVGINSSLTSNGIEKLHKTHNEDTRIVSVQRLNPQRIIVNVETTKPFVLATSQELDRFWVATINGETIKPISLHLGLKGFMINKTGQLEVTLNYEPQDWFNYCLIISATTIGVLCAGLLYLNQKTIRHYLRKKPMADKT